MKLLQTVFVFTLMLFVSTGFAAKKEKDLICHVGNEFGAEGEVYLDDPGCTPHEDNDYFCPDAGKIDLIEVAKSNKHLENSSHTFEGISDYWPADVGASGEGKEDSDGDGIDDGCQPPVLAACPCWSAEEIVSIDGIHSDGTELLISTNSSPNNYCEEYGTIDGAYNTNHVFSYEDEYGPGTGFCQAGLYNEVTGYERNVHLRYLGEGDPGNTLTLVELQACFAEVQACVAANTP